LPEEKTKPRVRFPEDVRVDPRSLAAGRYGTQEMVDIWGFEKTFEFSLRVQAEAALTLADMHPDIVSKDEAEEIAEKADLQHIDPNRIRQLEEETGHDIVAINTALEEVVGSEAGVHINKARTSADTTESAKAMQLKESLEVIAQSVENLRDIILEKSVEWIDIPHMDTTHLYDALPTVAGRPLAHYGEMLQTDLDFLEFVYQNSIIGKWADATGNHHSAVALGIDGMRLQREYCRRLGIGFMDAPAQVPGLEFQADIFYILTRIGETMNNIAKYVVWGKSEDVGIFVDMNPRRRKGSSAMPHKDAKGGNPTAEEQVMSLRNYLLGDMVTALINCEFPYARNLAASANSRINFEDGFKFLDHCIRRLAGVIFWLGLDEKRSLERVQRTFGVVTSEQVLTYLTDPRKVSDPMPRSKAHDLIGELATYAWKNKIPFVKVLRENEEVTRRIDEETLMKITDPLEYLGESRHIIRTVYDRYHSKKTLG